MPKIELIQGDCLEKMKDIPDGSVDSIVTDPPYGLEFMGKHWDKGVPGVEFWQEMIRVLKPGGYLLAFGGTRTYHRMAVAIEDAGFEIRDMIEWVYGSGFPKSLNIGKKIDQLQGNEREEIGVNPNARDGGGSVQIVQKRKDDILTKGTSEWEGWGTALKPAHEPICMARKPLDEKTVAANVLKWGTGGINIDESRVKTSDKYSYPNGAGGNGFHGGVGREPDGSRTDATESNSLGRFPANLIHDNSEEVRECFPETKSPKSYIRKSDGFNDDIYGKGMGEESGKESLNFGDSGNASRFFKSIIYQAKASKAERNKGCDTLEIRQAQGGGGGIGDYKDDVNSMSEKAPGRNSHPCVKPVALMEYLINMVTREGQTVLDPFMGSGTTGLACKNLNRKFIGIELDPEYFKIAEKRINENL